MDYKERLKKTIVSLVELQDIIEEQLPEYYFVSEAIAKLNDLWTEIESDPELAEFIANLNN